MERVLDDESEVKHQIFQFIEFVVLYYCYSLFKITDTPSQFMQKNVLLALENAGVFTSSGLVKDKVMLTSLKNRSL